MHLRFCLLGFFMFLAITSQGQHEGYIGFKGSFQAVNANMSHTVFGGISPTSQLFGGSGGLLVKYFPRAHYGLQFEAIYTQKGFRQTLIDTFEQFDTSLDYLEFPFLFNIYLGKQKTQYFANLGPYLSFLVNSNVEGPENSPSERLDNLYDPQRDNSFAFGLKFAVGMFREFDFGGVMVDGFVTFDFNDFIEPEDLSDQVPDNAQNVVFGVSVGYMIPFGDKFTAEN